MHHVATMSLRKQKDAPCSRHIHEECGRTRGRRRKRHAVRREERNAMVSSSIKTDRSGRAYTDKKRGGREGGHHKTSRLG